MSSLAARIRWLRPVKWLVPLLVLVALAVPLWEQGPERRALPSSAFTDYFAARGQNYCWGDCPASARRVCLSGDCPCFDEPYRTQCFAERKANFERDNPPRGEITGVCWAVLGKSERDPQSGQQVFRTRSPVYTRVRFDETQVLSEWVGDDREAGFEVEVGPAWHEFIQQNYAADFPAGEGWNWSTRCVSLNSPRRTEDQDWARAQEQATYQRVFLPGYGVADTPEERALEAFLAAERAEREAARRAEEERRRQVAEARAAEEARQRAAAEAARQAEIARVEAARQQRVDAIAEQIGPGKRAEAERLQRMNDQLAALRPKPRPTPARQCTQRAGIQRVSATRDTREAAEAEVARARATPGGSETIVANRVSGASCEQRTEAQIMRPPPVGTCLACISEQQATALGWVKGTGWPPPRVEWVCTATIDYTAERCGSGTSTVTAQ